MHNQLGPAPTTTCQNLLLVSRILDHTSSRQKKIDGESSRLSEKHLAHGLDLIGDCAGHFRSFEMMPFALVDLVQARSCEVCLHYCIEEHLKHECDSDRVFGWWRTGLQRLLIR